MTIERISIKNVDDALNISLRGTLAAIASNLSTFNERKSFSLAILKTESQEIEKILDGECLVIGLIAERGKFFPDW